VRSERAGVGWVADGRLSSPSVDVIFTALLLIASVACTGLAGLVAYRLYTAER
jgi:hypothetical protein